jgi:PAS domain S-box-containing protein
LINYGPLLGADGSIAGSVVLLRNVTEQKQAQQKLRSLEDIFSKAFNLSPSSISIATLKEGRYVAVNESFLQDTGYAREEVIGRTIFELNLLASDEDRELFLNALRRREKIRNLEVKFRTKHNQILTALMSAEVIQIEGQKCLLAVTTNVTDRKCVEEALRQSEEQFRQFAEQVQDVVWMIDPECERIVYVNPAYQSVWGRSPLRLYEDRASFFEAVHPEDRNSLLRKSELLCEGHFGVIEYRIVRPDGAVRWIRDRSFPIRGGDGTIYRIAGIAEDITEQKLAEEALRQSETRYKQLVESANDIIYRTDSNGCFTYANPIAARITEYSQEELIGKSYLDLIRLDWRGQMGDFYVKQFKDRVKTTYCELPIVTKTGKEVWIGQNVQLLVEGDRVIGFQAVARDITERRQAEEALRDSEAKFRALAESASCAIFMYEGEKFIYANQTSEKLSGYSIQEILRMNFWDLVHPDFRDLVRERGLARKRGGSVPSRCEFKILTKDGQERWVDFTATMVKYRGKLAALGTAFDITERKVAEAELARARQESEKERLRLRAIIDQMGEGLIILDGDGNVVGANQQAQKIFGAQLEQIKHPDRFSNMDGDPIQPDEFPAHVALKMRSQVENVKLRYTRPDGQKLLLSINATPFFDESGQLAGAISLIRDITLEQKESERAQQAEKLRALGQLSFGVAHNFNNALAAIIGHAQLALRRATEPEVRQFLGVIEQSARDAARMVERIQNFSRSEAPARDFVPVKLVDILRDAVDFTRPRWRHDAESLGIKYDLSIEWRAPEDLLVRGEPSELREVFVNIILNALDAMPTGGSLQIVATSAGQQVSISFTDTGIGMTEEIRRRAFEPFFTTKGASGLGMGLSESYRITERHGGRIDIESQPGHGSTFTITLPIITNAEPLREAERRAHALPRRRILVVDDERFVAEALSAMLSEHGHEVVTTFSAEEALSLFRQYIFDIVFADLAMPKVDGMALAAEVKSLRPETKIVLMSGYGPDKLQERAADSNAIDAVVTKPFYFAQIESLLESLI